MLEPILLTGAMFAVFVWAVLALYVVHISRHRTAARAVVSTLIDTLNTPELRSLRVHDRVTRVKPLLEQVSRDMILHTAADASTPRHTVEVLSTYLVEHWGVYTLIREASSHRASREVWRRTAALTILFHLRRTEIFNLLRRAVEGAEADVASVALALLGTSDDPRATEILIDALRQKRHPASRVAVHLEHSPLRPVEAYRALIADTDPVLRLWGATLLAQCPDVEWLEETLAALTEDPDARVRKAAIQSLGKIGDTSAAKSALRLLKDPAPFVRAHAARALGELDRIDAASAIAELLGDADWWVRAAAKSSLEMLGSEVWPVLMRCLDNRDGFVRNGAAEVFQNLGILDSLIMMEAASDDPSPSKVDLLKRIANAGGVRMTDSLVERAGASAPKVRRLLASMGMERAGAA